MNWPTSQFAGQQGFMQDKITASLWVTCFGGHMDVNSLAYVSLQTFKCVWWPEMGYKHTYDTIYTHFQGISNINNIYGFGRIFALLFFYSSTHISTRSYSFLPVQMMCGRVST